MFDGVAEALAVLHTDKMDLYRHVTITNPNRTVDNVLPSYPLYADIPCRLSFKTLDEPYQTGQGSQPVTVALKVFCGVDVDIKAGDHVKVIHHGKEYEGLVGFPAIRSSHIETTLIHKERA